jgi:hypothetical protein
VSIDPGRDLRTLFRDMRDADVARAPAFARTLAPLASTPRRVRPSIGVLAAAMTVALVVLMVHTVSVDSPRATVPSIAEWRPASDVLLQYGRPAGYDQLQRLGTSSLDALVPAHPSNPAKPGARR